MKYLLIVLIGVLTISCVMTSQEDKEFIVQYKGALKNIMHKGDLSAKIDLLDLNKGEHLYALGALEDLKGEILIIDGEAFISSVRNDLLVVDHSYDHKATLLVYSTVNKWASFQIPQRISTYADLEEHIEQAAKEFGLDVNEPFPFLLEGVAGSFDWHVINWPDGDLEHSHEKHINSGEHGTLTDKEVMILGFYSTKHHAIFTHHTTNMHLHVKTEDGVISGHLDDLVLGKEMVLKLPDQN